MKKNLLLFIVIVCHHVLAFSQNKATITIDAAKLESNVSPDLHGIFLKKSVMVAKEDCMVN